MKRSSSLYGMLFLLVIGAAVIAGYVVASSISIGPIRPLDVLDRLASATPTVARVEARLVTPSPTVAGAPTTEAQPSPWPTAVTPVERPAPTVIAPTFGPGASTPGATTIPGTSTATATARPSPSPTRSAYLYVPAGAPVGVEDRGCFVGAVFGYVRDETGQALPGVHLRVYDPWNHNFPAISKPPPDTGYYDVILGTGAAIYYVVVVDSLGNQISPVVEVDHPEGARACWYQVDFRRTRSVQP